MPGKTRTLTLQYPKEFPVTVTTAPIAYQVKDGRKWRTICHLNADAAAKVTTYQESRGRGKFHGKTWRLHVVKTK